MAATAAAGNFPQPVRSDEAAAAGRLLRWGAAKLNRARITHHLSALYAHGLPLPRRVGGQHPDSLPREDAVTGRRRSPLASKL